MGLNLPTSSSLVPGRREPSALLTSLQRLMRSGHSLAQVEARCACSPRAVQLWQNKMINVLERLSLAAGHEYKSQDGL